jgi:GT2 family glycosyltransferase
MHSMLISAIVCTHNPRQDYLIRVLDGLKAQDWPAHQWELLVIDNGSKEPVARRVDLGWHEAGRVIREETLGLTNARLRGIRESSGEILIFVDDDNVLGTHYLRACSEIASLWPQLGVWGGSIIPEFEEEPEEAIVPFLSTLALREIHDATWANVRTCSAAEPWGAGLCVRKQAALAYADYLTSTRYQMSDRVGTLLLSGGDTEMCYVTCSSGLGMGVFPSLSVTHLIPRSRVQPSYIAAISRGLSASQALVSFKWNGVEPRSVYSIAEFARCVKQMVRSRTSLARRVAWARFRGRWDAAQMHLEARRSSDRQSQ